jgi:hypothetical protein
LTVVVLAVATVSAGNGVPEASAKQARGWEMTLGNGRASSFATWNHTGVPTAVGIRISAEALASLSTDPSDHHHCVDKNGDGVIAHATECADTHEYVVPLPEAASQRDDMPFKWVLLNWNLRGHGPPGIYDVPHFDVHFMMAPIADIFAIRAGPCGPELVNCDDFATAKIPLTDGLMHPDFVDVDAVAPAMGNHLIDLSGAEFNGEPFTWSWIYGMYGGRVTFYEEMVSRAYLQTQPDSCRTIKTPPAVDVSGHYPTQQCVRYDGAGNEYVISMEQIEYRVAR